MPLLTSVPLLTIFVSDDLCCGARAANAPASETARESLLPAPAALFANGGRQLRAARLDQAQASSDNASACCFCVRRQRVSVPLLTDVFIPCVPSQFLTMRRSARFEEVPKDSDATRVSPALWLPETQSGEKVVI